MFYKKIIIFLFFLLISYKTFADVINLKTGDTVEGKIIEYIDNKPDHCVKVDIDVGVPINIYFDEIKSIEMYDSIRYTTYHDEESFAYGLKHKGRRKKKKIVVDTDWYQDFDKGPESRGIYYGVRYDFSAIYNPNGDYYPKLLINAVNELAELGVEINGVKVVSDSSSLGKGAEIVKTIDGKNVLMVMESLTYDYNRLMNILKDIRPLTEKEKEEIRLHKVKRETLASVFDVDESESDEDKKITEKFAEVPVALIGKLEDAMYAKEEQKINIQIRDYYKSFEEIFPQ